MRPFLLFFNLGCGHFSCGQEDTTYERREKELRFTSWLAVLGLVSWAFALEIHVTGLDSAKKTYKVYTLFVFPSRRTVHEPDSCMPKRTQTCAQAYIKSANLPEA